MATIIVNLNVDESEGLIYGFSNFKTNDRKQCLESISDTIHKAAAGGINPSTLTFKTASAYSTATLTFTGVPANNETFVINGTTITAKTAGATGNEFNIGASATLTAAAIVTLFGTIAGPSGSVAKLKGITASSSAGVVTFTSVIAGVAGNGYTLAESMANCTAADFTGGAETNSFSV